MSLNHKAFLFIYLNASRQNGQNMESEYSTNFRPFEKLIIKDLYTFYKNFIRESTTISDEAFMSIDGVFYEN